MSFEAWLKDGWVRPHKTSPQEIEELFSIVDRDLKNCRTLGLSNDWRLNIAYNAALQASKIALAASGYRASREAQHYRTIQSLALTIGADKALVKELDAFRKKRNISDYEQADLVSDHEVDEIIDLAEQLREEVVHWLEKNHPHLFSK